MPTVTVKPRSGGGYEVRLFLGVNVVTGKPNRPFRSFPDARSEGEAMEMAQPWINTISAAASLHTTMLLADLCERYVSQLEARGAAPNTLRTYRGYVRRYVRGILPRVKVDEVTPAIVNDLYSELVRQGAGHGPLSRSTVRGFHWFLKGAFGFFVANGICADSPMAGVRAPSPEHHEAMALQGAELAKVSRAIDEAMADGSTEPSNVRSRNAALCAYLALHAGIRCGEACGLRLGDSLGRGSLHVAGNVVEVSGRAPERLPRTKGRESRNVAVTEDVADAVAAHVEWQRGYLPQGCADDPGRPLATLDGTPMRPTAASRWFGALRRDLGIDDGCTFHTLRHTHASLLLAGGQDVKTVQERLGHASSVTTLEEYAHVLPGRDAGAARAFEDLLRGPHRPGSEE